MDRSQHKHECSPEQTNHIPNMFWISKDNSTVRQRKGERLTGGRSEEVTYRRGGGMGEANCLLTHLLQAPLFLQPPVGLQLLPGLQPLRGNQLLGSFLSWETVFCSPVIHRYRAEESTSSSAMTEPKLKKLGFKKCRSATFSIDGFSFTIGKRLQKFGTILLV